MALGSCWQALRSASELQQLLLSAVSPVAATRLAFRSQKLTQDASFRRLLTLCSLQGSADLVVEVPEDSAGPFGQGSEALKLDKNLAAAGCLKHGRRVRFLQACA